ncbi:MAG: RNA polymerase sporulation sigma factor SigK [Ruminococcaceae bacterium]|nr:RNA polymerase sporulation sigma factor SigK [Oscillospiraceae bacterium]
MLNLLSRLFGDFFVFIGYLTNINSFPKPLSKKEEQELILKYNQGDEEARNTLIERNLRLVAFVAKKYYQSGKDYEDLISIGTIGLIKAINKFDENKGIRFATYAVRCIHNEILMCLRSEKKLVNEVSMNEPIGFDYEGNEINLMDILCDEEESIFNEVNLKLDTNRLYKGIESVLDEREREIIILRYGLYDKKALPQRTIAKKLGISRSYVSRIEKKALEKLEEFFGN